MDAMKRVNLILSREDSIFLDKLAREIDDRVGARVSRSEIVRASIAGMRELHRLAPLCPRMVKKFTAARFDPLSCSFHHEGQQMGAPAGLHHGHGEPALASPV